MVAAGDGELSNIVFTDTLVDASGNEQIASVIYDVLDDHLPYHVMRECRDHSFPRIFVETYADEILTGIRSRLRRKELKLSESVDAFCKTIEAMLVDGEAAMAERLSRNVIAFQDIPRVFTKNMEVQATTKDADRHVEFASQIMSVRRVVNWNGTFYQVFGRTLANFQTITPGSKVLATIPFFEGERDLSTFPIIQLSEEKKREFHERGRMLLTLTSNPVNYLHYTGQVAIPSYWHDAHKNATGRIVIDPVTFSQLENDLWSTCVNDWLDNEGDEESSSTGGQVPEAEWHLISPFVYGYSMTAKSWGRFNIEKVNEIQFSSNAFSQLVMDERDKEIIRALVEYSPDVSFTDIVSDKGGGCIMLLTGPPGQGKTLTAEAVADLMQRPLYSITVGELGTTPDQLEARLRRILSIAEAWDAVLLLDECDIFMEARKADDIERNAMVGVFLRLLEYHNGVMFLTTNRSEQLDQAMMSRISAAFTYDNATSEWRKQVWSNLLKAANLDDVVDAGQLETFAVNGRQIKNCIKMTLALAASRKIRPTTELVIEVIRLLTR